MPPPVFRRLIGHPNRSPGWMRRQEDAGILEPIGNAMDHFFALDTYRMLAGLPTYSTDASLREICRDRHVLVFNEESRASQIAQAQRWLLSHFDAGLPVGVLQQNALLWLPEVPRYRLVAGNSQRAMWTTVEPDGTVTFLTRDASNGGSNWDWWSEYFADPAVPEVEPTQLYNYWVVIYAPPSVSFPTAAPRTQDPIFSLDSSITVQFGSNLANKAQYWSREGSRLCGVILASDPASFDPALDNTAVPGGYPDGTWWRRAGSTGPNRLSSAYYYAIKAPPGAGL